MVGLEAGGDFRVTAGSLHLGRVPVLTVRQCAWIFRRGSRFSFHPETTFSLLRFDYMQRLRAALGAHGFAADDFQVEERVTSDRSQVIVAVTYQFEPAFRFVANIAANTDFSQRTDKGGRIVVDVSPGTLLRTERLRYDDPDELLRAIQEWTSRVQKELRMIPVNRAVAAQQADLEKLTEQFGKLADEYFTQSEAAELRHRLDDLESRMAANIREHADTKKDAETKIADLHRDIETLKERLDSLRKPSWAKTFAIRVANWMKDPENQRLLKSGAELAKTVLLPPGDPGQH